MHRHTCRSLGDAVPLGAAPGRGEVDIGPDLAPTVAVGTAACALLEIRQEVLLEAIAAIATSAPRHAMRQALGLAGAGHSPCW